MSGRLRIEKNTMFNVIMTSISIGFVVLGSVIGYYVGFLKGVSDAAFFESSIRAIENIHALRYIENNEFDRVRSMLTTSLEASIVAVDDIYNAKDDITKVPSRVMLFRGLYDSLDMENDLNIVKTKYANLMAGRELGDGIEEN